MMILRKAGPLQTSAENSGGTMWHAVEEGVAVEGGPALCRVRPGVAWSSHPGHAVTCPRCRTALSASKQTVRQDQQNLAF
jgi:rubredoxin